MPRPPKYPIRNLEIGETILLEWDGELWPVSGKPSNFKSMLCSIHNFERRTGRKFQTVALKEGMRVTRIR